MIAQTYRQFARLFGDSTPIRSLRELDAAIRAAGLDYPHVTREWLRRLNPQWVYGDSRTPFTDHQMNRRYRRMLHQ